jgi:hypothetical protein
VQREHVDAAQGIARGERGIDLRDFTLARQEDEHIACVRSDRMFDRAARLRNERFIAPRGEMRDVDGIAAPRARQARRIEELREPLAVERGRHHDDAQVLAQSRLHVEREGQAEVARQVPLVEFVEQQARRRLRASDRPAACA